MVTISGIDVADPVISLDIGGTMIVVQSNATVWRSNGQTISLKDWVAQTDLDIETPLELTVVNGEVAGIWTFE